MTDDPGLTRIALPELEALIRGLELGRVATPLTRSGLQAAGLEALEDVLPALAGLDQRALLAVLRAVVAERRTRAEPHVDLVWTGPDARGSAARDTSVVVAELFARARQSVLMAGYSFDDTQDILAPLHAAMRDRQVEASVFVDLTKLSAPAESELADPAETAAKLFLDRWWPFGDPKPAIFYDPRTAQPRSLVSLHAKCVVVDDRTTLITSANFTRRGHDRNLELGALIEDPGYARAVVGHWRGLVSHGVFQRLVLRSSP